MEVPKGGVNLTEKGSVEVEVSDSLDGGVRGNI